MLSVSIPTISLNHQINQPVPTSIQKSAYYYFTYFAKRQMHTSQNIASLAEPKINNILTHLLVLE